MASVGSTNNVKWQGLAQDVTIEQYHTEQSISRNMKYMFQKLSEKRDGSVNLVLLKLALP